MSLPMVTIQALRPPCKPLTCGNESRSALTIRHTTRSRADFVRDSGGGISQVFALTEGDVVAVTRRSRGAVELAVRRTLRDAERLNPAHEGLSASAMVLARSLDDGAGLAVAAVARELRATLAALTEAGGGSDGDDFDALLARLSSPVGDGA